MKRQSRETSGMDGKTYINSISQRSLYLVIVNSTPNANESLRSIVPSSSQRTTGNKERGYVHKGPESGQPLGHSNVSKNKETANYRNWRKM